MRKLAITTAAALTALAAFCAHGAWVYEGEFILEIVTGLAVAPNDNVYAVQWWGEGQSGYVFYFTPTGSILNNWWVDEREPAVIAVAPNTNVYVGYSEGVVYYTGGGGYLGKWRCSPQYNSPVFGVAVAANGNVYASDPVRDKIHYFTATGSKLGEWGGQGSGNGEFNSPSGVAVAPNTNVYVADHDNHRIQYFTSVGSFLGKWGSRGTGDGQLRGPSGVAAPPDGYVYVADTWNNRIQYFTPSGSFLGKFGKYGTGKGTFYHPEGLDLSNCSRRLYVADAGNNLIQYFRWTETAVAPASLGRVKALFR
ncbi:MAG: hypothetical protein V3W11_06555 [bacterium]